MSHLPEHLFGIIPEALRNPRVVDPEPLSIREWNPATESITQWIKGVHTTTDGMTSLQLSIYLGHTAEATSKHEKRVTSIRQAFQDPLDPDALLPEEQEHEFIATIVRSLNKRLDMAFEEAEARVMNSFYQKVKIKRTLLGMNN
ncbi:hypothetical protein RHS01_08496 [Rhizoctonia solani]|uniref:Uncharacterized protein n=1 Tax=Rhizoctonia solani TaxID=456999 RepID=A0A8H7I7I0_9AGAM|nr:hypothetical protein RHS01_08496 [Rhizoctonia solani]